MSLQTPYRSKILGTGGFLPEKVVTNFDLEKLMDTTDAWIVERTGIRNRHYAAPGELTSDLAYRASLRALEAANTTAEEIDMILFATVCPDQPIPNTACILQQKLGCRNIGAVDLNAACTGFIWTASIADQFIRSGACKKILAVGAEELHHYLDFNDRTTAILFGDASGAAVIGRADENDSSQILSTHLHADGSIGDLLVIPAGGSKMPYTQEVFDAKLQRINMKGRELFKHAVRTMSDCCVEGLEANGLTVADVDWLIPHQANLRIIEGTAKHVGIPMEKVIVNIQDMGNASAATIPIAMTEAIKDGRIKRGQTVVLVAFGGGITSGSIVMRY